MNKISFIYTLLIISTIFTSCTKIPFVAKQAPADKALVYIYVAAPEGVDDSVNYPKYTIKQDAKFLETDIGDLEYIVLELDPTKTKFTAIRAEIEMQDLALELKAGNVYYLRIRSYSDEFAQFDFEPLQSIIALEEIKQAKNAISQKELDEKESQQVQISQTKAQKIRDAHQLKVEGILTQKEFEKLKAEILDANR